jgi:hypothetical protein
MLRKTFDFFSLPNLVQRQIAGYLKPDDWGRLQTVSKQWKHFSDTVFLEKIKEKQHLLASYTRYFQVYTTYDQSLSLILLCYDGLFYPSKPIERQQLPPALADYYPTPQSTLQSNHIIVWTANYKTFHQLDFVRLAKPKKLKNQIYRYQLISNSLGHFDTNTLIQFSSDRLVLLKIREQWQMEFYKSSRLYTYAALWYLALPTAKLRISVVHKPFCLLKHVSQGDYFYLQYYYELQGGLQVDWRDTAGHWQRLAARKNRFCGTDQEDSKITFFKNQAFIALICDKAGNYFIEQALGERYPLTAITVNEENLKRLGLIFPENKQFFTPFEYWQLNHKAFSKPPFYFASKTIVKGSALINPEMILFQLNYYPQDDRISRLAQYAWHELCTLMQWNAEELFGLASPSLQKKWLFQLLALENLNFLLTEVEVLISLLSALSSTDKLNFLIRLLEKHPNWLNAVLANDFSAIHQLLAVLSNRWNKWRFLAHLTKNIPGWAAYSIKTSFDLGLILYYVPAVHQLAYIEQSYDSLGLALDCLNASFMSKVFNLPTGELRFLKVLHSHPEKLVPKMLASLPCLVGLLKGLSPSVRLVFIEKIALALRTMHYTGPEIQTLLSSQIGAARDYLIRAIGPMRAAQPVAANDSDEVIIKAAYQQTRDLIEETAKQSVHCLPSDESVEKARYHIGYRRSF